MSVLSLLVRANYMHTAYGVQNLTDDIVPRDKVTNAPLISQPYVVNSAAALVLAVAAIALSTPYWPNLCPACYQNSAEGSAV